MTNPVVMKPVISPVRPLDDAVLGRRLFLVQNLKKGYLLNKKLNLLRSRVNVSSIVVSINALSLLWWLQSAWDLDISTVSIWKFVIYKLVVKSKEFWDPFSVSSLKYMSLESLYVFEPWFAHVETGDSVASQSCLHWNEVVFKKCKDCSYIYLFKENIRRLKIWNAHYRANRFNLESQLN